MGFKRFRFDELRGVSSYVIDGLNADLAFCHPAIRKILLVDSREGTIELEVSDNLTQSEQSDLQKQLSLVIDMSIKSFRFVEETPPLWIHESRSRYNGSEALQAFTQEYMTELGPGQFAYHGPANELYLFFCNRLQKIADEMNAEGWCLPNIEMTHDVIAETGYFSSHPQLVTFGYRLPPHCETIKNFAEDAKSKKLTAPEDSNMLEPTGFILEPFVCHNIYRSLNNRKLSADRIISAQGKCYRYEGYRFLPLLRQWEFSMREIVLVGEHDFVMAARQRCIELTQAMIAELDLDASLEVATDPFFVSAAASARTFQMMQSTKLELKLRIDDDVSTAAVSFNIHGKHFTRPMEIYNTSGDVLETSCCAFGIERWMAAFVARWTEDPAKWQIPA